MTSVLLVGKGDNSYIVNTDSVFDMHTYHICQL